MKYDKITIAIAVLCSGCSMFEPAAPRTAYVDEFDLSPAVCGLGKSVHPCKSVDGHALTVNGNTYARGFGTRPESAVLFRAEMRGWDP